jgi:hypothetical protein
MAQGLQCGDGSGGRMKNYLSCGGGVNSVAMQLLLIDQGVEFEAVFVDHGTDWPETYEYMEMFQSWLTEHGHKPITILKPVVGTVEGKKFDNLYDYYYFKKIFPFRSLRTCTDRFKLRTLKKYQQTPCFVFIGYAYDERHRAKISSDGGREYRFPLIEQEIDREGCKKIILDHGLPVPIKSGCYICPYQKRSDFKELRRKHPDLFCKAERLENNYIKRRESKNKEPIYIKNKPLKILIEEAQIKLWEEDEYPPCECGM